MVYKYAEMYPNPWYFHASYNRNPTATVKDRGRLAQSGASLTANQGVAGSSPGLATYFRGDLSWNNFFGHSPLPLIQEGQMSVSGESMCHNYWLTV